MATIINAFRIFLLSVITCNCFSLIILLLRQRQVFFVLPVANAFTSTTSYNYLPVNKSLRRECRHHPENNNNNKYGCLLGSCSAAWLRDIPCAQQQQRRRLSQGQQRLTTLQLEATTKTARTQEQDVDDDVKETTLVVATSTRQAKFDKLWLQQFEALKTYRDTHGDCIVPRSQGSLGLWVSKQRVLFHQDRIREDRKKLLDGIGFTWRVGRSHSKNCHSWMEPYDSLKSYKKENGHCNVPANESSSLSRWVTRQRVLFNCNELSKERINLLDDIGFVWAPLDEVWTSNYKELEEMYQMEGHVDVWKDQALAQWAYKQRLDHAAGRLDPNKKAILDELGFIWKDPDSERYERQWNEKYRELVQYKLLEGHARVPVATPSLGPWVRQQRKLYHNGSLLEHRQEKLESVGFIWRLREYRERDTTTWDKKWMKMYDELQEFYKEHGHANIPWDKSNPLWVWVDTQRVYFQKGELREDRKKLLDEIGFEFDIGIAISEEKWQRKYKELQAHKKKVGNANVLRRQNVPLSEWARTQRILQQAGRLDPKREELLDELGIEWD